VRTVAAVDPAIVGDIKRASQATNMSFGYLMAQANQESSFQPDAKAPTGTATGLYQFLDQTWLGAVKQWGGRYGLGEYAASISMEEGRTPTVADPAMRQRILDLRKDPAVSAELAAEFARQNKSEVEHALGRPASATDLYLAHFLGAQGATNFLKKIEVDGSANAAELMPQAAAANRWVFYDDAGNAKSVSDIYRSFANKIESAASAYADETGVDGDTAAEALALNPEGTGQKDGASLLTTMNVLSMAAMRVSGKPAEDHAAAPARAQHRRPTDTSA
jgi:soluble lytic murein transglycosylase-like protein